MAGAHQNLNDSRDQPRPFKGWFAISRLELATVFLPSKFDAYISTHYMKIWKAIKMPKMEWFGVVRVTQGRWK